MSITVAYLSLILGVLYIAACVMVIANCLMLGRCLALDGRRSKRDDN